VQKFLLILQHNGEDVADVSLRLCANVSRWAIPSDREVSAVVFGICREEALKGLGIYGIKTVYQAPGSLEDFYSPEIRAEIILNLVLKTVGPSLIFLPQTVQGREVAPLLATRLDASFVSDCVQIDCRKERIEAIISIYGGQYQTVCEFSGNYGVVLMADVNCGHVDTNESQARIVMVPTAGFKAEPSLQIQDTFFLPATELDIGEADIVVGIGRGVETEEDHRMMLDLAAAIGAPIGGTRPAVDAGWIPFEKQIGQTGRIVAPELYVAAGISGAVQHITGVEKAKIIAINKDPQAPILRLADLGVIGDFKEIAPLLVQKLREIRKEGQE